MTQATLQEVRVAFMAAQQSLMLLREYPQALLNVASFPYRAECAGEAAPAGFADADKAIALLEYEVASLKAMRQNYLAARAGVIETV